MVDQADPQRKDVSSSQEINRAVDLWGETVGGQLLKVLAPIYQEGPKKPELIGSGILVRVAEFKCLVTAAHVPESAPRGRPLYFGNREELIPLAGMRYASPHSGSPDRSDDRVDLAWWALAPETAAHVNDDELLGAGSFELDATEFSETGGQFYVNGYPYSRQPRQFDGKEWSATTFAFITEEQSAAEYESAAVDRQQNVFVHFDKSDTWRQGKATTGPNLDGVSGGAIWRVTGSRATPGRPRLAGIATSWRKAAPKGIIGLRAHILAAALSKNLNPMRERAAGRPAS